MDMRVAVLVVIDPIGDHPFRSQIVAHELPHQRDVLSPRQLFRQRDDQLARQLRVGAFLESIDGIPQRFARLGDGLTRNRRPQPGRYLVRKSQLLMHQFGSSAAIAERCA